MRAVKTWKVVLVVSSAVATGCGDTPPSSQLDASRPDASFDSGVLRVAIPDAAGGGGATDAGTFDAPVPSALLGDACGSDADCIEGECLEARLPGVDSVCASPCGEMGACPAGSVCDVASGLCGADNALGGRCAATFYDVDGDPSNGCEYACAGRPDYPDSCNGVDDDCDTRVDEAPEGVGEACAVAGCGPGRLVCSGGVFQCEMTRPMGSTEVCNGTDDDCDGRRDELCPERLRITGDVTRGMPFPMLGATPFEGACPEGHMLFQVAGRAGRYIDRLTWNCRPVQLGVFRPLPAPSPDYLEPFATGALLPDQGAGFDGGAPFPYQSCPDRSVMVGLNLQGSEVIDGLAPVCQWVQAYQGESTLRLGEAFSLGYYGGSGGSGQALRCPPGQVLVGFHGSSGYYRSGDANVVFQVGLLCRPYRVELAGGA